MLVMILAFLTVYWVDLIADLLNIGALRREIPGEFKSLYDPEKLQRSRDYVSESTRFDLIRRSAVFFATLAFWVAGGFNWIDLWARGLGWGSIGTGLAFAGALSVLRLILQIPFSAYDTFRIEEKFGFNRTTPRTFVGDLIKGLLLSALLGGLVFAGLIWFFERAGREAWLYAWLAVTAIQLLLTFVAPVWIMPLFNRFKPLPDGELKRSIEEYLRAQNFEVSGIFTMDGSKRSTKANAFFTGFGKYRRLVLFDTLIEKQSTEELVAVFAHEVGHFKLRHIPKSMGLAVGGSLLMFWALGQLLGSPWLFEAFRMAEGSVYAGIVFIGFLFSPVMKLLSLFTSHFSRRFEYEADQFAARTYGKPETLVSALKKLSADNLSHLTPHRLKVILDYTHPPILERIAALRATGISRS